MLLLVTAVFAIGAIALIPKGEREQVELCYVNIRIESEGEITTYGMVVEDCETVAVLCLKSKTQRSSHATFKRKVIPSKTQ